MSELQQANEERRQAAEGAFLRCYQARSNPWVGKDSIQDWATIASEMGITDFYKRLKEGK